MHSLQPSRGRIFFEVLCAVGIAASCGGAWMQTGASALLAAASVATLYALVHFFDLFRRAPSLAAEPQRIEFEQEPGFDVPVRQDVVAQQERIEQQLAAYSIVEEPPLIEPAVSEAAQPVDPAVSPPVESRRTKAPRKTNTRRVSASKKAKSAELAAPEARDVVDFAIRDQQAPSGIDVPTQTDDPVHTDEPLHPPVAPLFEPEPFVRQQQRSMFGRKAG